jgi:hypothetical protein
MVVVFTVNGVIVKFNVTMLSQPAALVPVHVAVLLDVVYVVPFQSYESHATIVSVVYEGWLIVKFNVTMLSQPAAFVPVHVAVLLDVV